MNISISVNEELLNALDDYRAKKRPIPKVSVAIRDLIWKSLLPKEESTEVPKVEKTFKERTLIYQSREGRKDRCYIQLISEDPK